MIKKILFILFLLISTNSWAICTQTQFNVFTGKPDYCESGSSSGSGSNTADYQDSGSAVVTSGTLNAINNLTITNVGGVATLDIADAYLLNTGDTGTGTYRFNGNVGIGTAPATILDLSSTTSALRVTRLTNASSIAPKNGMIAYDSNQNQLQGYVNGTWVDLGITGVGTFVRKSGDTMTGSLIFSNVTSDIKTPGTEHLSLMPGGNVGIGITAPSTLLELSSAVATTGATIKSSLAATVDSNTKLLIHADGADASTAFSDVSPSLKTITTNGNAQVDTAQSEFGGASLLLDGNGDYLELADSSDWDLFASTSTSWTVDLWFKRASTTTVQWFMYQGNGAGTTYIGFVIWDDNKIYLECQSAGISIESKTSDTYTDTTNWHHVVYVKIGGATPVYAIYVDGVQKTYTTDTDILNISATLRVGAPHYNTALGWNGWMDEPRITYSNYFNANPNVGLTDVISDPTSAYSYGGSEVVNFKGPASINYSLGYDSGNNEFMLGTTSLTTNTRLAVNSNGNLGVGTISPLSTLDVAGNVVLHTDNTYDIGAAADTRPRTGYFATSIFDPLLVGGTGTTSALTLKSTSGVGTTGADIIFQAGSNGGTEIARMINAGNLGIGYTAPGAKLSVNGNIGIGQSVAADRLIVTGGNVGIGYTLPGSLLSVNGNVGIGNSNAVNRLIVIGGNVGIGSSNPLALMDLSATNNALRVTRVSNASTLASRNGMIAYDSNQNQLQGYINGTWTDLGSTGGSSTVCIPINPGSMTITGTMALTGDATQGAQIDGSNGQVLLFDATTDEGAAYRMKLPSNWSAHSSIRLMYSMASATANEVEWEAFIMCQTGGDSERDDADGFAALSSTVSTVPGTIRFPSEVSITPTDDSCAANDLMTINISTDSDDAVNDDATGDRRLLGLTYCYTTQ
jgi:hypothetical protein